MSLGLAKSRGSCTRGRSWSEKPRFGPGLSVAMADISLQMANTQQEARRLRKRKAAVCLAAGTAALLLCSRRIQVPRARPYSRSGSAPLRRTWQAVPRATCRRFVGAASRPGAGTGLNARMAAALRAGRRGGVSGHGVRIDPGGENLCARGHRYLCSAADYRRGVAWGRRARPGRPADPPG